MEIEVHPPLADGQQAALERALTEAGVEIDATPEVYRSAWRRAAVEEAVDYELVDGSVRSPRSTRGATRA